MKVERQQGPDIQGLESPYYYYYYLYSSMLEIAIILRLWTRGPTEAGEGALGACPESLCMWPVFQLSGVWLRITIRESIV